MRASATLVRDVLVTFETAGLVRPEPDGDYRYAPAGPALAALADQLELTYRERPVAVVNAILASPNDKLQSFADAFRLNGDRK
jgi:hypothetical protein